jgi:Holliday junction DNA helicase RuvB
MAIGDTEIPFTPDIVSTAMRGMDIDVNGLTKTERTVLRVMSERYGQRPVGIRAIASAVGESYVTLEEVVEPNLVRLGYVNREARGRTLTPEGLVVAALESEGVTEY